MNRILLSRLSAVHGARSCEIVPTGSENNFPGILFKYFDLPSSLWGRQQSSRCSGAMAFEMLRIFKARNQYYSTIISQRFDSISFRSSNSNCLPISFSTSSQPGGVRAKQAAAKVSCSAWESISAINAGFAPHPRLQNFAGSATMSIPTTHTQVSLRPQHKCSDGDLIDSRNGFCAICHCSNCLSPACLVNILCTRLDGSNDYCLID